MGMATGSVRSRNGVTPAMNVTPLVDVVLVLLIIFMVVTPLLAKQLWLVLPKKDDTIVHEPPPAADENVVLTVGEDGQWRINDAVTDKAALPDKLARILAAKPDRVLYFDAADEAPYGAATEAMDAARAGGARTIAVLTRKIER